MLSRPVTPRSFTQTPWAVAPAGLLSMDFAEILECCLFLPPSNPGIELMPPASLPLAEFLFPHAECIQPETGVAPAAVVISFPT